MNRILHWPSLVLLILLILGIRYFYSSGTNFEEKSRSFIITASKTDKASILDEMEKRGIIKSKTALSLMGSSMGIWKKIKPGKYEVYKNAGVFDIARMLKNGHQAEVKLVINRIRTKEELAKLISKNFESDSATVMKYISSNDSIKEFGVDTNSLFTIILPDTYAFYWNDPLWRIFRKLSNASTLFWRYKDREEKIKATGLTKAEVYTLASIVDEETNYESDKYKIASVYLNRLNKSMPLQACPTIKYAMKDFTLTRIYEKYLSNPSPYNTYRRKGLPPGPICTPSPKTIDIILDAPKTNYLFFVAKSDFSGYHHFSSNFTEHSQYAKEYQKALDIYMAKKQNN